MKAVITFAGETKSLEIAEVDDLGCLVEDGASKDGEYFGIYLDEEFDTEQDDEPIRIDDDRCEVEVEGVVPARIRGGDGKVYFARMGNLITDPWKQQWEVAGEKYRTDALDFVCNHGEIETRNMKWSTISYCARCRTKLDNAARQDVIDAALPRHPGDSGRWFKNDSPDYVDRPLTPAEKRDNHVKAQNKSFDRLYENAEGKVVHLSAPLYRFSEAARELEKLGFRETIIDGEDFAYWGEGEIQYIDVDKIDPKPPKTVEDYPLSMFEHDPDETF